MVDGYDIYYSDLSEKWAHFIPSLFNQIIIKLLHGITFNKVTKTHGIQCNYTVFKVLFISNHYFTRKPLILKRENKTKNTDQNVWLAKERRLSLKIAAIKTIPNNLIRVRTCLNFKNFALTPTHWTGQRCSFFKKRDERNKKWNK